MEEIWKDIPGCENNYQVSNTGQIRSLDRHITDCIGRTRYYKSKILTRHLTIGGYWAVKIKWREAEKVSIEMQIHRAVAAAFLGFDMNSDLVIDHKNGNKLDNSLENLEAVTVAENNRRARVLNGKFKKGGVPYFTKKQVMKIRDLYASGQYTKTKIAQMYGVQLRYICNVINFKTQTHKFKGNGRTIIVTEFHGPDQTGELGHNAKLTNAQVFEIRKKNKNGVLQKTLAAEYGVCTQTICNIINNKTYRV